jgi:hypothetical protein
VWPCCPPLHFALEDPRRRRRCLAGPVCVHDCEREQHTTKGPPDAVPRRPPRPASNPGAIRQTPPRGRACHAGEERFGNRVSQRSQHQHQQPQQHTEREEGWGWGRRSRPGPYRQRGRCRRSVRAAPAAAPPARRHRPRGTPSHGATSQRCLLPVQRRQRGAVGAPATHVHGGGHVLPGAHDVAARQAPELRVHHEGRPHGPAPRLGRPRHTRRLPARGRAPAVLVRRPPGGRLCAQNGDRGDDQARRVPRLEDGLRRAARHRTQHLLGQEGALVEHQERRSRHHARQAAVGQEVDAGAELQSAARGRGDGGRLSKVCRLPLGKGA